MNDLEERLTVALRDFASEAPSSPPPADRARHRGNRLKRRRQIQQRLSGAAFACVVVAVSVVALGNRDSSRRDITGTPTTESTSAPSVVPTTTPPSSSAPTTSVPSTPALAVDESLYPDVVMIADPPPAGVEVSYRSQRDDEYAEVDERWGVAVQADDSPAIGMRSAVITRPAPEPFDNMPRVTMGSVDAVLMVDQGDFYTELVWPYQGEWMRIRARGLTRDEVFRLATAAGTIAGDPVPTIVVPPGFSEVARGEMVNATRDVIYQTGGLDSFAGAIVSTSRLDVATMRRAIESPVTDLRDIVIDGENFTVRIVRSRETAFSNELWFRDGGNVVYVNAGSVAGDDEPLLAFAKTLRRASVAEWLRLPSQPDRVPLSPYAENVSSFACEDGRLGVRNDATGDQTCLADGNGLLGSLPAGTRRTAWLVGVPKAAVYEVLGGRGPGVSIPELTRAGATPGITIESETFADEPLRAVIVVYAPNGTQRRDLSIESRSGTTARLETFDITTVATPAWYRIREVPCEGGWTVDNVQADPSTVSSLADPVCVPDDAPGGFVGTITEPDGKVTYIFWTPTDTGAGGGSYVVFDKPNVVPHSHIGYGGDRKLIAAFTVDPGDRRSKVTVTFRIDSARGNREVVYTATAMVR
jgi:hypothetical protein